MHSALSRHPLASHRRGVAAWGYWLLRWSLVLLLIADQLGAPLHHHHHDAGIDGIWSTASADHAADELVRHVEDADHVDHFSHSTLVLRGSCETVKVSAAAEAVFVFVQFSTALALLAAPIDDAASWRPPPGWRSPFISAHRSLPPAGRAPPLHA